MIIDFHTHIFPEKTAGKVIEKLSAASRAAAFTDGTIDGLINSGEKCRINYCVNLPVATSPQQVERINDFSAKLNEKFNGEKIISFAAIHPDFSGFRAELSRIKNLGIKGVKIHPIYQDVDLDDARFLRIFERAAELGLIVVTHAGFDIGFPGVARCTPEMARRVVKEIGDFKFVLAHMGGWKNWSDAAKFLADTKVFVDTSFSFGKITPRAGEVWREEDLQMLTKTEFENFAKIFGADRILFGTDSPWSSQGDSVEFIRALNLDESDKEKILGKNAEKLLGS